MASDDRGNYSLVEGKQEKGELEPTGIILPPLRSAVRPLPNRWLRKLVIAAIITTIVLVITITAVTAVLLTAKPSQPNRSDPVDRRNEPVKQMKPEIGFQIDLKRVYGRIMDENSPEDLRTIFEYYKSELSDVRSVRELREFLSLLKSEGLTKGGQGYDLTREDVEFAVRLTEETVEWYRYMDELRTNLTWRRLDPAKLNLGTSLDIRKRREVEELVKRWTRPMEVVVTNSSVTLKRKVVALSEVSELLRSDPKFEKPNLKVFASGTLFLDADLYLPQTNLALIAPTWSFVKDTDIFISGLNAIEHSRSVARPAVDGLPGRPGGNGGHFLGIGDIGEDRLRVYSDGGKGGDGQNGANGRNGTEDATGDEPHHWSDCATPFQVMTNKYGEVISYYKVYRPSACGGNGTNGGAAGKGGHGGSVLLVDTKRGHQTLSNGRDGVSGVGGRGGTGGVGTRFASYYYGHATKRGIERVSEDLFGSAPDGFSGRDNFNAAEVRVSGGGGPFFADAIQEYRAFARDGYVKGDRDAWRFLAEADKLLSLDNVTWARHFLREMDSIDENGEIEFYDSLSKRIGRALRSDGEREVLTYLRALSYGRMLSLKRGTGGCIIVDLDVFLEKIADDLRNASLVYDDRTTPTMVELLEGKIDYLQDNFDRWIDKANALEAEDPCAGTLARATSVTAELLKQSSNKLMDYLREGEVSFRVGRRIRIDVTPGKCSSERFSRHEKLWLQQLTSLSSAVKLEDFKRGLGRLGRLLKVLNDLVDSDGEVSDFPVSVEYLVTTLDLLETVRERENFKKYIEDASSINPSDELVKDVRESLVNSLITSQYKDALSAFRQWVFPHVHAYDRFLPKNRTVTLEEARTGVGHLRKWLKEYKSTITSYDKHVREATFKSNSSVGEYYRWSNSEIRSDLANLFRGRKVLLTSEVENVHMLTKGAIKFRTARLEFQSRSGGSDKLLSALRDVNVEMRHSGYSYYFYNGRKYLQVGDGFDLHYSCESGQNGEPANVNMVYKKLMDGPAIHSPYTTWTVQLQSVNDGLLKFVDDVDVALVGSGTYIEVPGGDV